MTAPAMRGLALVFICFVTASAQSALQPLPVEVASTAKSFAAVEVDLSPDGAWVAYTLVDPRRRKLQGLPSDEWKSFTCSGVPYLLANTDLLISNTKTGRTINISSGTGANWGPSWSPDGKSLAFYSDRSGKAHVWIWEQSTGKLRALTTAVAHVRSRLEKIFWTSDSRQVLTKILGNTQTLDDCFDGTTNRKPFDPAERSVYTSEASPLNLPASTDSYLGDLATLNTRTGNVKRIVRQERIVAYSPSPSGDRVVYVSPTQVKPNNPLLYTYNLSVVSLLNGQAERVNDFSPGVPSLPATWSPDGQTLAYISDGECFIWPRGEQPRKVSASTRVRFTQTPLWDKEGQVIYVLAENKVWRIPTNEAKATAVTTTWDRQIRNLVARHDGQQIWSPDGEAIYVNTSNSVTKQEGFYRIDSRSGEFSKVFEGDISITSLLSGVSNDDEVLVYAAQNGRQELNLWLTNRNFTGVRQLTHINPDLERYPASEARLIDYATAEGKKLQATLLLPVNYQSDKRRYPLIVWVYGGSLLSSNVNRYGGSGNDHFNMQLFSSRGYAVLLPDTPLNVGTPMQDLAKTVLPALDKAIEMGVADPDRLGVMGTSYGGYSTLALIVQTARFKAAVMDVGSGNLTSMYGVLLKNGRSAGVGWAEEAQGRMGGPPWQFLDRYIQNSPAFFLNKIETPLLISQGGMDTSPFQADEIFVGLRRLGKKVVYVRYEYEGHGVEHPGNRIDYWNRVIEWFDSSLRPATQPQPSSVRN